MESIGSFGGWGVGVYLKRPVLESVSLIGGSGVSLTTPVMETGRSSGKGGGVCLTRPVLQSVRS